MAESESDPQNTQKSRFGIGSRLYIAFGGMVFLTLVASAVAWLNFSTVESALRQVSATAVPDVTNNLQLALDAANVAASAPDIISAKTEEERGAVVTRLEAQLSTMTNRLDTQASINGETEDVVALREMAERLAAEMKSLGAAVATREEARGELDAATNEILAAHQTFLDWIGPMIEDGNFNLMLSSETVVGEVTDNVSDLTEVAVVPLRRGLELSVLGERLVSLLAQAANVNTVEKVEKRRVAFMATAKEMLAKIKELSDGDEKTVLNDTAVAMIGFGLGEQSVFALRKRELNLSDEDTDLRAALETQRVTKDEQVSKLASTFNQAIGPILDATAEELNARGRELSQGLGGSITRLIEDVASTQIMLQSVAEANLAVGIMTAAAIAPDADRLNAHQSAFITAADNLQGFHAEMSLLGMDEGMLKALGALRNIGLSENSVFVSRARYFKAEDEAQQALTSAKAVVEQLKSRVSESAASSLGAMNENTSAVSAVIDQSRMVLLLVAVASVAIGLAVGWLVVNRNVVARLISLSDVMRELAAGNNDVEIAESGSDEITAMASTVTVFRDNAREVEAMRAQQLETERKASADRQRQRVELASEFEKRVKGIVNRLGSAARRMEENAQSMANGAENVRSQSGNGVAAAQQTSANVQTVASATEELSASLRDISAKVSDSSARARQAADRAQSTNKVVESLEESAGRIDSVVNLIQDIAEQTNLLALNATIEAARAGEAGKGFAVVASEVKNLAGQTAQATAEITAQVKAVQEGCPLLHPRFAKWLMRSAILTAS